MLKLSPCFSSFILYPLDFLVAPVPVNASVPEPPAAAEKSAKTKAEMKAERRARQDVERASKQGKKEGGQTSSSKPKAFPSELQPGNSVFHI